MATNLSLDPDLIDRAADLGMSALAITDHGNLFGAVRFFEQAVAFAEGGTWEPVEGLLRDVHTPAGAVRAT